MVESHLKAGRQDLLPGKELVYGLSITDACIGWDDSRALLDTLADAVVGAASRPKQTPKPNKAADSEQRQATS